MLKSRHGIIALAALACGQTVMAAPATGDASFDRFLERAEAATITFTNGDPGPTIAILSDAPDVTLMGGAGAYEKGGGAIKERFQRISGGYGGGRVTFEYVSAVAQGDLAYTVAIERREIRVDGSAPSQSALRATNIYRKEDGEWRLIHRHADPLLVFNPLPASAGTTPTEPQR